MTYTATYYLAKPLRLAFERKTSGAEPCRNACDDEHIWLFIDLYSKTGENALFHYHVSAKDGKWQAYHMISVNREEQYSCDEPVSLEGTLCIRTADDEFEIHFIEFMSDYNDTDYAYLTEALHREKPEQFEFPDRDIMTDIVDKWYQGQYSEFVRANILYHETFDKEAKRTKTGNVKSGEYEKWCKRHGVTVTKLHGKHHKLRALDYNISDTLFDDRNGSKDVLQELYFGLMCDIYEHEKKLFLRTDPREILKRKVSKFHSRYQTFFGMDVCDNHFAYCMPFPLCLRTFEYIRDNEKEEADIILGDLVPDEELEQLLKCYEELEEAERKITSNLAQLKK